MSLLVVAAAMITIWLAVGAVVTAGVLLPARRVRRRARPHPATDLRAVYPVGGPVSARELRRLERLRARERDAGPSFGAGWTKATVPPDRANRPLGLPPRGIVVMPNVAAPADILEHAGGLPPADDGMRTRGELR